MIVLRPSRKTGWSSTLRMRIGLGVAIAITPFLGRQLYWILPSRGGWLLSPKAALKDGVSYGGDVACGSTAAPFSLEQKTRIARSTEMRAMPELFAFMTAAPTARGGIFC